MTENKSIIIDGVKVSECDYFCPTKKQVCYANNNDCNKSPNCYFKQLARKTQDEQSLLNVIDDLQQQKNKFEAYYNDLGQDYDQLKVDKAKLEAQIEADTQYHIKEECNLRNIIKNKEKRNILLYKENNQLKIENETYKKMLDNPEVQVALSDVRTGERGLWQKYKSRMEKAEQKLEQIREIIKEGT